MSLGSVGVIYLHDWYRTTSMTSWMLETSTGSPDGFTTCWLAASYTLCYLLIHRKMYATCDPLTCPTVDNTVFYCKYAFAVCSFLRASYDNRSQIEQTETQFRRQEACCASFDGGNFCSVIC